MWIYLLFSLFVSVNKENPIKGYIPSYSLLYYVNQSQSLAMQISIICNLFIVLSPSSEN